MSGPSKSAPPSGAPPGPAPAPPPGYPAYPPYPWYPPPPARDNTVLIIVIVILLVLLVPVVLSAILYVMVSGLIRGSMNAHMISFGPVGHADGNATIPIFPGSSTMTPSSLQVQLTANRSASAAVGLPPPNGSVTILAGGYSLWVAWLDRNQDGLVGPGDAFWITGNLKPLPRATSFAFTLLFHDGPSQGETTTTWSTT